MNIRKDLKYLNNEFYKMVVYCDCPTCKQPNKEFIISKDCTSVINNFFICPSCVQLQPKVRSKLVKSSTNQWKNNKSKMIKSINDGNKNPQSSINRSIASKSAWSDPIKRESMLEARKPGTNYYESHKNMSISQKMKISETVSELYLKGKLIYKKKCKYKTGWFHSIKSNIDIYYRSNLELKFLNFFEHDDNIIFYQTAPFKIKYNDNNLVRNYCPDFLIKTKNNNYLIEVKPRALIRLNNNLLKIKSAKIYCKNHNLKFKVLVEEFCNDWFIKKYIR